jgi:hypothetical protein
MPIDQVLRGLALRIDTSVDPETQPLLEYSFIEDNTQRILARIRGRPQSDGGGQLAFETNAGADTTTPRMLIGHQGNVGIGTESPTARLEVGGDAKFDGPLSVHGTLAASGLEVKGADPARAVKITGEGAMISSMWTVTQVYLNEQATPTPVFGPSQPICPPKLFTTGGGTLLILASGSGAALSGVPGPVVIGMDLVVDNNQVGGVLSRVNNMAESKPFLTSGLVVRGIAPGSHTLTLKTAASTVVGLNDFFNITILELPFQ